MNYKPVGLRVLERPRSRWRDQFWISERALFRTLIRKKKNKYACDEVVYKVTFILEVTCNFRSSDVRKDDIVDIRQLYKMY
jgi:hypothetical protein